jgi:hypothetical protein
VYHWFPKWKCPFYKWKCHNLFVVFYKKIENQELINYIMKLKWWVSWNNSRRTEKYINALKLNVAKMCAVAFCVLSSIS